MDGRSHSPRVIAAGLAALLALGACGGAPEPETSAPAVTGGGDTQAEADLAKQAAAMQKTILQGAVAGGLAGGAIGFGLGGSDDIGSGVSIGLATGAAAGTYVAFVQRSYIGREARLRQIKTDLDQNAAEMQTTINVMNQVLASQKADLDALKAKVAAGEATEAELQSEIAQANGNFSQMELAIDGATKRQSEFTEARGLTLAKGESTSPIDSDLADLQNRIAQMKGIANDLATAL